MQEYIIVRAFPHYGVRQYNEKYVLLSKKNTYLELIENPCIVIQNGIWYTSEGETSPHTLTILRASSRYNEKKEYTCTLTRSQHYIVIPDIGEIYVYTMTNANKVLSSKYYKVCAGEDRENRWHFEKSAPSSHMYIPQHIFRCFVDDAIKRKEECPITLEPLTKETVAGTQCGHLFNREAIMNVLRENGSCPTCRAKLDEKIQYY